jgi:hypothetical protein
MKSYTVKNLLNIVVNDNDYWDFFTQGQPSRTPYSKARINPISFISELCETANKTGLVLTVCNKSSNDSKIGNLTGSRLDLHQLVSNFAIIKFEIDSKISAEIKSAQD